MTGRVKALVREDSEKPYRQNQRSGERICWREGGKKRKLVKEKTKGWEGLA